MKCTASNRKFVRKKRYDEGEKQAIERISIYLDSYLSDKLRYSNKRIAQIHATFNDVANKVQSGELSTDDMLQVLKEKHGATVSFHEQRIRPSALYSDFINGMYATSDKASIILLYVLIHVYGIGKEKAGGIIAGMSYVAESVNQGYVTDREIKRDLFDEEGLEVKKLSNVCCS